MEIFSSGDGWWQEVAALVLVAIAAAYIFGKLTGWPKKKPRSPPEQTPDDVRIGGRLARGLKKANKR